MIREPGIQLRSFLAVSATYSQQPWACFKLSQRAAAPALGRRLRGRIALKPATTGFHQFAVLSKLSFIDKVSIHTDPRQVAVTLVCSALL